MDYKISKEALASAIKRYPDASTVKLSRMFRSDATTVMNAINRYQIPYEKKNIKIAEQITAEQLLDVILKNPEARLEKLGKILGIATSTVYRLLKQHGLHDYYKELKRNVTSRLSDWLNN